MKLRKKYFVELLIIIIILISMISIKTITQANSSKFGVTFKDKFTGQNYEILNSTKWRYLSDGENANISLYNNECRTLGGNMGDVNPTDKVETKQGFKNIRVISFDYHRYSFGLGGSFFTSRFILNLNATHKISISEFGVLSANVEFENNFSLMYFNGSYYYYDIPLNPYTLDGVEISIYIIDNLDTYIVNVTYANNTHSNISIIEYEFPGIFSSFNTTLQIETSLLSMAGPATYTFYDNLTVDSEKIEDKDEDNGLLILISIIIVISIIIGTILVIYFLKFRKSKGIGLSI
ncbi:MAG: hypothetical protein GF317_00705 [Candidatus Lokiarchaeota archaeon]|nr:hypothetical protein [Candidatus Lokiarchaeota archaeon]